MLVKIQQMESKLITGGKDIVAHTAEQEEKLRHKKFVEFLFSFPIERFSFRLDV